MSNNIQTVQEIYGCFAKGDIPGILEKLGDNVTFFNGADPDVAPFGGEFKGKNRVVDFFTALDTTTQTTHFEPSNFSENGNRVFNEVQHNGLVTVTGKPFNVHAQFAWEFDGNGKAIDWKGTGDFSSMNNAFIK